MTANRMKDYISRGQAQNLLGCSKETIMELLRTGELETKRKENGGWLVSTDSLKAFINNVWTEEDGRPIALQKRITELKAEVAYLRSLLEENNIEYEKHGVGIDRVKTSFLQGSNQPQDDISIIDLRLSNRALKALDDNGIHSIQQLLSLSRNDLMRYPGIGKYTVNHIVNKLQLKGLDLTN